MTRANAVALAWIAAALAGWLALRAMSPQFVWGEGHANRPIIEMTALLAIEWLIFWALARHQSSNPDGILNRSPAALLAVGLSFHLLMLCTNPMQEHDGYRYLWDGAALDRGVNPYLHTPKEIDDRKAASPEAVRMYALLDADAGARQNLERVGYPEVRTVYPPVALASFWLGHLIGGWSWDGLRLVYIAAYFIGAYLLTLAVPREKSTRIALLLALCPLAVKEVANSTHVDALLVLWFGALVAVLSGGHSIARVVSSGALLGLATATKLYPVMLTPMIAAFIFRRSRIEEGRTAAWRDAALFCVVSIAVPLLLFLPFAGVVNAFSGLETFIVDWRRNAGLFTALEWLVDFATFDSAACVRFIAAAATIGVAAWRARVILRTSSSSDAARETWRGCALLWLVWFLLLPMAFPWYLIGALPFVVLAGSRGFAWLLMANVACIYYLFFVIDYWPLPVVYDPWRRAIEYAIPFIFLAIQTIQYWRSRRAEMAAACAPFIRVRLLSAILAVVFVAFAQWVYFNRGSWVVEETYSLKPQPGDSPDPTRYISRFRDRLSRRENNNIVRGGEAFKFEDRSPDSLRSIALEYGYDSNDVLTLGPIFVQHLTRQPGSERIAMLGHTGMCGCRFVSNEVVEGIDRDYVVTRWRLRYPEAWWGHFYRYEVWGMILTAAAIVWLQLRPQGRGALSEKVTQSDAQPDL